MNRQSKQPKKTKGLKAGIIAFGVTFALFSVIIHPSSLGRLLLGVILAGLAGSIVRIMGSGLDLTTHNKQDAPAPSLQKVAQDTGNPEVDAILQRGRQLLADLDAERKLATDKGVQNTLLELENQCAEIFRAVYDKPAKASQIRKFMDYYLPTTLKMVRGFRTLDERGITGAQAQDARRRIGDALDVVIHGCQRLLENLYRDDVLDLTTDIDVLEQMLKRDGLTESDLERAAAQAREAARIDAEANRISRERAARGNVSAQGGQASATATRPNDRT